jgi:HSP20 family molecular chaperone IbpA
METYRKDSDYVVWVDLPGVDPKDVHVEAEGNVLTSDWTFFRHARAAVWTC